MRQSVAVLLPWLGVLAFGDASIGAQNRTYTVRDSAGIAIVENRAALWKRGDAWRFAEIPTLQVGPLIQVRVATRLSDGRIVVGQNRALRCFSADGACGYGVRAGEKGGEFVGSPSQLRVLPADSVGAATVAGPEHLFDGRGIFARTVEFWPHRLTEGRNLSRSMLLGDGTRLLSIGPREIVPRPRPGVTRPPHGFVRFDPVTLRQDTLGWFPGVEYVVEPDGRPFNPAGRPFPRSTMPAAGGDRVYLGDSNADTFLVFSTGKWQGKPLPRPDPATPMRLRAIVRKPVKFETVTAADREEWAEWARAPLGSFVTPLLAWGFPERTRVQQEFSEEALPNASWPNTKPAFAGLLADRAGNLWIQEYTRRSEPLRYTVIDWEGRWLGTVSAPPGVTVLEIGDDYMLGIWKAPAPVSRVGSPDPPLDMLKTSDDPEFIRVYLLVKRLPPRGR